MHLALKRMTSLALLAAASTFANPAIADTLLVHNVQMYTPVGQEIRSYSGFVVRDGRIASLLPSGAPLPNVPEARRIGGKGKTVLPGLIDAHGHVLELGRSHLQVDLRGTQSVADALERIGAFAQANPKSRWILGSGWNQVLWSNKQFPTAKDLDKVLPDRPAMLSRVDGHAVWVNSLALKAAGVTRATKDPAGGQIVRDANGEPTGIFVDNAMSLIDKQVPPATDEEVRTALAAALADLSALGLTGVHDAGVDMRTYAAYRALGEAGQLSVRIYAMLADGKDARPVIAQGPKPSLFDDRLQLQAVKAWVDGALGSRGAHLLADYADQAHHRGLALYTPEQIKELGSLASQHGWQLNIHAIGDAGNRIALDTFEQTFTSAQRSALRPRIEHAQVISLDDLPRFARLNVIASMQPTHATSDMNMAEDRIGPQRIKGAYAWRTLLDSGARMAFGSDFPVELPNPFLGLYAAVTRQDREGHPPGGWHPEQKLTRAEALRLFTLDAAYASGLETKVGSLEPGKWADFIIIDRDYFKVPESEIDDIKVEATYVAGARVSQRAE